MKTVYVDVYFLINFTVDLLAIFFAVKLLHIYTKTKTMVLGAIIGALEAVIYTLFFETEILGILFSIFYFLVLILLICRNIPLLRKIKFAIAFSLLEMILGGSIYYLYITLSKYMDFENQNGAPENRKLLIFAVMVLLSIGILKLALGLLSASKNERTVNLAIEYEGREYYLECFVDSGNFACDPIDKSPAVFIVPERFEKIFGTSVLPNDKFKTLLRIIPVKNKNNHSLYYGIKYDNVYLCREKKHEKIKTVLVLGDEKAYAGYDALAPASLSLR